ncbi:MAG: type I DNA topoisomerase [Pseudomonadota bacterium]|nr:type I DNA topoisomerase [Pseudomonadota bacterium]
MPKPLVIVESPAKARTISKFLGAGYVVEASKGHVRDLPERATDVSPEHKKDGWTKLGVKVNEDFKPLYVISADRKEQVASLKALVKDASIVYLATDEDREGESISWHLREVLKPRVPVKRLVFHEITLDAINKAIASPRDIDEDLVHAQEARRIVDRLYGYEVSPLLWHKVRGGLSAGRVQSVAVRLLVDRERARCAFRSATWWDIEGSFTAKDANVGARLIEVGGKRLATGRDFDESTGKLAQRSSGGADVLLLDEPAARALVARLLGRTGKVDKVDAKPWKEKPYPPFTTSTMQQEAIRKFRWSAKQTMDVAQRLYESGWITYMRTDSFTLSEQAITAARSLILQRFGKDYLHPEPRIYKTKVKNAQEAHEAIRPAGETFRDVEDAQKELSEREARLYELIWKRTVACQMSDAHGSLTSVILAVDDARFVANGKVIKFPGFRRAYVEGSDDPEAELADQERPLPALVEGERVDTKQLDAKGHTTQPPARLTEATLVKELEARGIGRPSTYASIIDKILEKYAFKRGGALVPTFVAFAVTELMEQHLSELVDYTFTARIEDDLDRVALGNKNWVETLREFYLGDLGLQTRLGQAEQAADPRKVCTIPIGKSDAGVDVVVRVGKFGPFLSAGEATADLPEDVAPDEVTLAYALERLQRKAAGPTVLGKDPAGLSILLMNGRFGPFVQRGEMVKAVVPVTAAGKPKKSKKPVVEDKPDRASLLPGMEASTLTLDMALQLLSLPRTVGPDPKTGEEITAANGRYGPYVRRGKDSRSVPPGVSVLEIGREEASKLFDQPVRRARTAIEPLRVLGADPVSGGTVNMMKGRFGPYVTDGTTNASLPRGVDPDSLTLGEAAELLVKRREAGPSKPKRGAKPGRGAPVAKAASAKAEGETPKAKAPAKAPAAAKAAAPAKAPAAAKASAPAKASAAKAPASAKPGSAKKGSKKAAAPPAPVGRGAAGVKGTKAGITKAQVAPAPAPAPSAPAALPAVPAAGSSPTGSQKAVVVKVVRAVEEST